MSERRVEPGLAGEGTEDWIFSIERPVPALLLYGTIVSLVFGPFFWIALLGRAIRYHTLRYRFDREGVSMCWGILFRREIHLTYSRIQDIHLRSNLLERWLGLARIEIQTASGSARAEMTIEGLPRAPEIRDFIYGRMRGLREGAARGRQAALPAGPLEAGQELVQALREAVAELRALRQLLSERRGRA